MTTPLIAVTTPTGTVGRQVTALLTRAGIRPRVLLRDPDRLDPELRDLVDPVPVDLLDGDAVLAALDGVDALYFVAAPVHTVDDPTAAYVRQGEHVARAVTEHGVGRVVFQSSIGAERRQGAGEIDGLGRVEELLQATPADVCSLRCGFFFTNLLLQLDEVASGTVRVLLPTDQPLPWVDPRDIAEVGVARVLSPAWSGHQVQAVHGPIDLSWDEAASIVSAATGRTLQVERIADDAMRRTLAGVGMSDRQVEAIVGMSVGLRDDFVPEQPRTARSTTPSTLQAWAYAVLRPALDAR